jgi:hypothetical protein
MKKGTKLYSIFKGTCPACHEAKMFKNDNPYKFKTMFEMHENCPNCNQKFTPEPGYYYGAMYVSYGLGVAFFVAVWVAVLVLVPDLHPGIVLSIITVGLVLLAPASFRMSRKVWINMFIHYKTPEQRKLKNGITK